ncbi:MAG: hypothetical protein AAF914_13580 [Pseudomonadota bacterium]
MDYGIRLFRHVVEQVLGNLGPAARITAAPSAVVLVLFIILQLSIPSETDILIAAGNGQNPAGLFPWGLTLVAIVAAIFVFSWVAVGWHRFVLLEEEGTGFTPNWLPDRTLAYIGWTLLIGLILIGVGFGASLVIAAIGALFGGAVGIVQILFLALTILLSWMFLRFGLVLPASSVNNGLSIGESWKATGPVSGDILVPLIGFGVIFFIISLVIGLIFGTGVFGLVLGALVSWVQILVNLAILTTLYGNLVEGRELN